MQQAPPTENKATSSKKAKQWLAKNRTALVSYNKRLDTRGVFSDGVRLF